MGGHPSLSCRTNVPSKLHFKDETDRGGPMRDARLPGGNTDEQFQTEEKEEEVNTPGAATSLDISLQALR